MDLLVQIFFNNVNYHYYIVYPPRFLEEYKEWWDRRARHEPVTLQWTSLLVVIIACATQHLDFDVKPKIEADLGEISEDLTERYNNLSRDLAAMIPNGRYHLINVQRMLHSIYWYKSEARFVEAWHLIGAAVREAQELGLHADSESNGLPEFEREMRRRIWCILATWDWQFASGLCRPTMIDHGDVHVKPPTLTLENVDPSPLLYMKLQSECITTLAARFKAPKNVKTAAETQENKRIIEKWMHSWPAVYDVDNPDYSKDRQAPWATSHRFYLHTMAYLMILNPIRPFLTKSYSRSSPPEERQVRADGIYYALRNLDTTCQWAEFSSHQDGRYHFIIFSLFDTATVLCTATLKDDDRSIPRKEEILAAIESAVALLRRLYSLSNTAKRSYEILSRIARRLPRSKQGAARKRARLAEARYVPDQAPVANQGYVPVEEPAQAHGYSSASTSPSNFAPSATAESSPHSNTGAAEVYAHSTPDSAVPSLDGAQTITTYSSGNTMVFDHSVASGNIGNMMHAGPPGMMPSLRPSCDPMAPPPQMYVDHMQPPMHDMLPPGYTLEPITDAEMGEFNRLWDWQSLNLDFISSEAVASGAMP